MSSRLFVAELIDQFERHGNPALPRWQERHTIADRTCAACSPGQALPCQGGDYFADTFAFSLGQVLRGGENIIIDSQCGSHGLIRGRAVMQRIIHHASRITWMNRGLHSDGKSSASPSSRRRCLLHLRAADSALCGVARQPFLQRGIHAGLPARTACAKGNEHFLIEPDGHLLLGGIFVRPSRAANRSDGRDNAASASDRGLTPIHGGRLARRSLCGCLGRGDFNSAKGLRSSLRLACGRHSGRRSSARSHLRAVSRQER
jgi:hypothetical protein